MSERLGLQVHRLESSRGTTSMIRSYMDEEASVTAHIQLLRLNNNSVAIKKEDEQQSIVTEPRHKLNLNEEVKI